LLCEVVARILIPVVFSVVEVAVNVNVIACARVVVRPKWFVLSLVGAFSAT